MDTSASHINLYATRAIDIWKNVVFSRNRVIRTDRPSSRLVSTKPLRFASHSFEISLDIVTERESVAFIAGQPSALSVTESSDSSCEERDQPIEIDKPKVTLRTRLTLEAARLNAAAAALPVGEARDAALTGFANTLHIDDWLPRPDSSGHDRENGPSRGKS
jgi:hypothetical protein